MKITHCRINHLENPLGFSLPHTVFSWQITDSVGHHQTDARIVVSAYPDLHSPIADTGFRPQSSLASALELSLLPRTRYYWTVTARTDAGEKAASSVNWFETAKQNEPWQAQWIGCDDSEPRHPIFCKTLPSGGQITAARLYVCGLGLYEATLNGEKIGDEYLTPGCTAYDQWIQYQTYDITAQLQKGGDLQITLGNGWYKGRFGYTGNQKPYYGTHWALLAEIHISYADGSTAVIGTDESWKVRRSNITFSNIYDGERLDATLPALPEVPATPAEPPKGSLTARYSVSVQPFAALTPVLLTTPAGETVLDLGQNMAGSFRLHVNVPAGQTVRLQWGETLQDGNFYRGNLRTAKAEYEYISDGTSAVIEPKFTFFGGRYVKVAGVPDIAADDFTPIPLSSTLERIGTLTTGHALVNRLIENVWWSCRDNFIDVPTDCPQRDERMGWTGDAQVFSGTASYMLDTFPFYAKYLHDIAAEQQNRGGAVPNVIPAFGIDESCSVWGDAATIIPWTLYQYSGDTSILQQQYSSMKAWVDYITKTDGNDCGWRKIFHFGDWLALDYPSAAKDNTKGGTDEGFIADIYYMYSAEIVAETASLLDKPEDAAAYSELAQKLRARIRKEYYTPTDRCAVATQTGLLLTLRHQLADKERTAADLRQKLADSQNTLQTGFVGTGILCNVLSENGMGDLAVRLLLNEEYPGWLHEVKLGATTIWERWNSLDDNGHISSTGMNSLNHYSYGAILEWMYRHLAGLCPTKPGFTEIDLCPTPVWALRKLDCSYQSAAGSWQVHWQCLDLNHLHLEIHVPFGCTARLTLPLWPGTVEAGNPIFAKMESGVCILAPGDYALTYETTEPFCKIFSTQDTIGTLLASPAIKALLEKITPGISGTPISAHALPLAILMKHVGIDDEKIHQIDQALAEVSVQ